MKTTNLAELLVAADTRKGFPAGTMASLMKQESGGQERFTTDPAAYHYPLNAEGKRVAGHSGAQSSAFGLFGILESTGSKPGYGVEPLKNKSIEEQVRFASDYLAGRSKEGGLSAGLAGYGEGPKYAAQVMSRIGGTQGTPQAQPQVMAPQQVAAVAPTEPVASGPAALPAELLAVMNRQPASAPAAQNGEWQS